MTEPLEAVAARPTRSALPSLRWLAALVIAGCAGPAERRTASDPLIADVAPRSAPAPAAVKILTAPSSTESSPQLSSESSPESSPESGSEFAEGQVPEFSPRILEPTPGEDDPVVAVVGSVEIRASQVFARQLESDRRRAELWIDALVLDVVIAQMAERYAVEVDPAAVARAVTEEEELLRAQVEHEWGDRLDFAAYVQRQFGLTLAEYRAAMRRDLARVRFRGLVMRYVATLEDRAEVRFMVHHDPAVLREARERVLAGADFAQLARRSSEDESRRDGGRLGPFGREFRHPITAVAFELDVGAVSDVFPIEAGERHALVYCLRRLPRDGRTFAELAGRLRDELDAEPISPFEQTTFMIRYCRSSEGVSPALSDG